MLERTQRNICSCDVRGSNYFECAISSRKQINSFWTARSNKSVCASLQMFPWPENQHMVVEVSEKKIQSPKLIDSGFINARPNRWKITAGVFFRHSVGYESDGSFIRQNQFHLWYCGTITISNLLFADNVSFPFHGSKVPVQSGTRIIILVVSECTYFFVHCLPRWQLSVMYTNLFYTANGILNFPHFDIKSWSTAPPSLLLLLPYLFARLCVTQKRH